MISKVRRPDQRPRDSPIYSQVCIGGHSEPRLTEWKPGCCICTLDSALPRLGCHIQEQDLATHDVMQPCRHVA